MTPWQQFSKWLWRDFTSVKRLTLFVLGHGILNVLLTMGLVTAGYLLAALICVTWGNIATISGYTELNRRTSR